MQLTGLEGVVPKMQPMYQYFVELKVGTHRLRSRKLKPEGVKWDDQMNPHVFQFALKTDSSEVTRP